MRWLLWLSLAYLLCYEYGRAYELPKDYSLTLNQLSVDFARYKDDTRDPILYPIVPSQRLDLGIDLSFLKYGYLNNLVHSMSDSHQFRLVGWYYQLGVHIGPWLDIYGEHFSQHLLDEHYSNYPVSNALGVKVYLYRR